MDKTIELSDSSTEETIVLDDTNDKNKTIDLESSVEMESDKTTSDHYVTAASNTKFLENASPPKVTSTPNVQPTHGDYLFLKCYELKNIFNFDSMCHIS